MSIARSILERKLDRQAANKRSADGVPQPNFEAAMDEALRRVILGKNSTDGENAEHRGIPERAGHVPVLGRHFEVGVLKRAVGADVGQRDDIQSADDGHEDETNYPKDRGAEADLRSSWHTGRRTLAVAPVAIIVDAWRNSGAAQGMEKSGAPEVLQRSG